MKTEIIKCEICTAPATLWLDKVNEVGEVCITCSGLVIHKYCHKSNKELLLMGSFNTDLA